MLTIKIRFYKMFVEISIYKHKISGGSFMKRKNEGITLIALVITIILMLILAAVVIGLTIGKKWVNRNRKRSKGKNK